MAKGASMQLTLPAVAQSIAAARKADREARRRRGGRPRKPSSERGSSHAARPVHLRRYPVHVTVRVARGMPSLRDGKVFPTVRRVLQKAAHQFRQMFRIVEYSVQSNHVHLLVEAADERALSRGMQGFGIRLAKNLNARLARSGRVLSDRYHARTLRTPTQALNTLRYVRQNAHLHRWRGGLRASWQPDPCSTAADVARAKLPEPTCWLLGRARAAFS